MSLSIVKHGGRVQDNRWIDLRDGHRGRGRGGIVEVIAIKHGGGGVGADVGRHHARAVSDPCRAEVRAIRGNHIGG